MQISRNRYADEEHPNECRNNIMCTIIGLPYDIFNTILDITPSYAWKLFVWLKPILKTLWEYI